MIKLVVTDVGGTLIPEGSANPAPVIADTMQNMLVFIRSVALIWIGFSM